MNRFVAHAALLAALALPNAALAQTTTPRAAGAASPPAAAGPAPPAGPVPAEVMPPSSRSGVGVATSPDSMFVRTAAAGGLAEIRMGQLAAQKAQSAQVRVLARRMVADHTQLAHHLESISQRMGLTLPTQLDTQDVSAMANLSRLSQTSFDGAYLRVQVADHEMALSAFQQEAEQGTDPDLKAFAQAALPILRQHLQMAKDAETSSP